MWYVVLSSLNDSIDLVPALSSNVGQVFQSEYATSLSWQLPAILLCFQFWHKDWIGMLTGVSAGYAILLLLHLVVVFSMSWEDSTASTTKTVQLVQEEDEDTERGP